MLNNFSSYFEIFAGLNLAYAGSKGFRNAIDDEILKLKNKILPHVHLNVERLQSEFVVMVSEDNGEIIDSKLTILRDNFDKKCEQIIALEEEKIKFTEGFKSMFLATALYCVALLLLGGYEQYFLKGSKLMNLFLLLLLPIFLFNSFVFLRSFTNKHHKNIKPLNTIFFFLSLFLLCFCTLKYCPYEANIENLCSESTCITFSLITALSPYLFHFLRVFIHKLFFKFKFYQLGYLTNRKLKKISDTIDFFAN